MSSIAFGPVRRKMYFGATLVGVAVKTGSGWRLEAEPGQPVVEGRHQALADLGTAAALAKKEEHRQQWREEAECTLNRVFSQKNSDGVAALRCDACETLFVAWGPLSPCRTCDRLVPEETLDPGLIGTAPATTTGEEPTEEEES